MGAQSRDVEQLIVRDFGHFDAPVVLFGGIYSNLHALEALIKAVGDGPAISTGDLVAYAALPSETVARFRALGWPTIAGNCERQIADGAEECGCGFDDGSACDLLSRGWYPHALTAIGADDRDWMAVLPDIGTFVQKGRRYAVIHGGASDIARFIWPTTVQADFETEIALVENAVGAVDGIVAGHSGIAFHRMIGRHQWINAGAVGLPPHDGRSETRFAVLDAGDVVIHRLSYDHEAARVAMEKAGLTQGYHEALTSGIWPSEDVLPTELRR